MPDALAFNLNFLHPLMMWGLLALSGYSMFLGIKAKKHRIARQGQQSPHQQRMEEVEIEG